MSNIDKKAFDDEEEEDEAFASFLSKLILFEAQERLRAKENSTETR